MLSETPSHALEKPKWGKPTKTTAKKKEKKKMSCLKILFQNRSKKKFFCCDLWVAEERNKSKKKRRVFLLAKRQNLKKEEFLVLGFSWLFVSRILFRRRGFQPKIKSVFVLGQKCLTISTKIISKADRNNEKKETTKRNNVLPKLSFFPRLFLLLHWP